MSSDSGRVVRVQVLVALVSLALVAYLFLLGRTAWAMIRSGDGIAVALGSALMILPLVGGWALLTSLQAGLAHQRLARIIHDEGRELDVSALPRRRSGRIERDAADALFDTVRAEVEADPQEWRGWYRLARAYDHAGDRKRARVAMGRAVALQAGRPAA